MGTVELDGPVAASTDAAAEDGAAWDSLGTTVALPGRFPEGNETDVPASVGSTSGSTSASGSAGPEDGGGTSAAEGEDQDTSSDGEGGASAATDGAVGATCPSNEFDADPGAGYDCRPLSDCPPGTYYLTRESPLGDRVCPRCKPESYADTVNAAHCIDWSYCSAGEVASRHPSDTANTACEPYQSVTWLSESPWKVGADGSHYWTTYEYQPRDPNTYALMLTLHRESLTGERRDIVLDLPSPHDSEYAHGSPTVGPDGTIYIPTLQRGDPTRILLTVVSGDGQLQSQETLHTLEGDALLRGIELSPDGSIGYIAWSASDEQPIIFGMAAFDAQGDALWFQDDWVVRDSSFLHWTVASDRGLLAAVGLGGEPHQLLHFAPDGALAWEIDIPLRSVSRVLTSGEIVVVQGEQLVAYDLSGASPWSVSPFERLAIDAQVAVGADGATYTLERRGFEHTATKRDVSGTVLWTETVASSPSVGISWIAATQAGVFVYGHEGNPFRMEIEPPR